jgi:NAD(P)-dependent dehydrogenase (short-subunit alcohol dehydrogenase family)
MKLKDKAALVTGAGRSIGEEIAKLYAKNGASVVVCEIKDDLGKKVVKDITDDGGRASFFHADVTKPEEVDRLIGFTVKEYGKIDILVNNVGNGVLSKITDQSYEEWLWTIDLTLNSAFLCSKAALKEMEKNDNGGVIVNIASIDGLIGEYGYPSYCAGKAGMINLTRNIALDFAHKNIRANAVCPGPLEQESGGQSKEKESLFKDPELVWKQIIEGIPMGKRCRADYVAKAALFLASDDAEYITGTTLVVDGGLLAYSGLPKLSKMLK